MTEVAFSIEKTRFDVTYQPLEGTRLTTNFANLARGENRQQNLRKALAMIDDRCNELASQEDAGGDRYRVELDIVSVNIELQAEEGAASFPVIEMLQTTVVDTQQGERFEGIVGNNFSSYVRDYDFSIRLPECSRNGSALPEDFGELHGNLFKGLLASDTYATHFSKLPVICISVSTSRTYHRTGYEHPVLGVEYQQDEFSLTDQYFGKMGMRVRYFMPPKSAAPLAFYFLGDLLEDYTNLELIATISTMETFQKIYRPEIYNANTPAGDAYQPSLKHSDFSATGIVYDRDERARLGAEQGRFVQENLIIPHGKTLEQWSARYSDYHHQLQGMTS
ncbi:MULTISPECIES: putative oxygenase MesX [Brevibacterium]|uniref:DUF1852 domain-containing protein n=1 Tax=Brevibacterium pityocampae TaxID=506594 RepID=A0ABP8JSA8_9MICO|nr:putative oxygenase MesX [Brevibacterium sp. CS2]QCP06051.1 DUF1852 domain-containing protein [Brevibacterium sp. CS2]